MYHVKDIKQLEKAESSDLRQTGTRTLYNTPKHIKVEQNLGAYGRQHGRVHGPFPWQLHWPACS